MIGERAAQARVRRAAAGDRVRRAGPAASLAGRGAGRCLAPLLALPLAVPLLRTVRAFGDPRELNPVLKGTARLALVFALLFAAGLASWT